MIIADTDVLIDFQRGQDPGASAVARELEAGSLATTAVSSFELLAGARSEKQKERIRLLLSVMPVLPLDVSSAALAATLSRELSEAGLMIATADALIAGICLEQNSALLTRNRKHFERVPDLSLAALS